MVDFSPDIGTCLSIWEPLDQSLRGFAQCAVPTARAVDVADLHRSVNDLCLKYQSVDSSIKDRDEELQLIKAAVKQRHGYVLQME